LPDLLCFLLVQNNGRNDQRMHAVVH
jgi:hypothetical protein